MELPIAEGPHGDIWFVAYRETCERVSVLETAVTSNTFTTQTTNSKGVTVTAGVALGACLWGATRKGDRWVGTVGKPGDRGLGMAAAWLAKNVTAE